MFISDKDIIIFSVQLLIGTGRIIHKYIRMAEENREPHEVPSRDVGNPNRWVKYMSSRPDKRRRDQSSGVGLLPTEPQAPPVPTGCRDLEMEELDKEKSSTELLARMIALHGYPSSIVEDEGFRNFVHSLNPDFAMPSRVAIERSCRRPIEDKVNELKEKVLQCASPRKINLATGTAETVHGRVMYMACHYIDDEWVLQKKILQVFMVVRFPPYHHGTLLGIDEVSIELDEGVLEKLSIGRTTSTLLQAVQRWGLSGSKLFSVAWFAELEMHLARKYFLAEICPADKTNMLRDIFGIPRMFCVSYTSDMLHSIGDLIYRKVNLSTEEACYKAVKGLRLSQERREQIFSHLGLNHARAYGNKWYSYYCSLEVFHKDSSDNPTTLSELSKFDLNQLLAKLLIRQCSMDSIEVREVLGISRFKETESTELLRRILGAIYRAIETVSAPGYPTCNICLEEVLAVRDVLQSEASDARDNVAKAVAYAKDSSFVAGYDVDSLLREAQGIVDTFLRESFLYLSIPVVLDPRFKMERVRALLNEAFGSDAPACIEKVSDTIQMLYNETLFNKYCDQGHRIMANDGGSRMAESNTSTTTDDVDGGNDSDILKQQITAEELGGLFGSTSTLELDLYLRDDLVPGEAGFDLLNWWKANSSKYPTLASMARDALAIPASDTLPPEQISLIRSMVCWPCDDDSGSSSGQPRQE